MNRPSVLVTGFDPFGGAQENSSQLLLESLDRNAPPQWLLRVLPTSYVRAEQEVLELLGSRKPKWALHLGLAKRAQCLRFERAARNLDCAASEDNDGERRDAVPICPHGPDRYTSGLALDLLQSHVEAALGTVEVSDDCGGFVCNHVFYSSAHYAACHLPETRVGFVHVPPLAAGSDELHATAKLLADWIGDFTQTDLAAI